MALKTSSVFPTLRAARSLQPTALIGPQKVQLQNTGAKVLGRTIVDTHRQLPHISNALYMPRPPTNRNVYGAPSPTTLKISL